MPWNDRASAEPDVVLTLLRACYDCNTMQSPAFTALLLSLPAHHSTVRMRVWRTLKSTGCAVLRDGVYVLPAGAAQAAVLRELEADVKTAGGFAMTGDMTFGAAELEHVRKLFDRADAYGALVGEIGRARAGLRRLGER